MKYERRILALIAMVVSFVSVAAYIPNTQTPSAGTRRESSSACVSKARRTALTSVGAAIWAPTVGSTLMAPRVALALADGSAEDAVARIAARAEAENAAAREKQVRDVRGRGESSAFKVHCD